MEQAGLKCRIIPAKAILGTQLSDLFEERACVERCRDKSLAAALERGHAHGAARACWPSPGPAQLVCAHVIPVSLYEYVLGNNVPIGSGDINNVCGEAHKCKLEFSSVVFVLNHLDETILKALSFPWHLE